MTLPHEVCNVIKDKKQPVTPIYPRLTTQREDDIKQIGHLAKLKNTRKDPPSCLCMFNYCTLYLKYIFSFSFLSREQ